MLNTNDHTYKIKADLIPGSSNIKVIGIEGFSSQPSHIFEFENKFSPSKSSFLDFMEQALDILIAKDKQAKHRGH